MFRIDLKSGEALYLQLKEQILKLVFMGGLSPNEQLPSVRNMARDLGINPNTVAKAYQQLEADGAIYSVPGKGSFIAEDILKNSAVKQNAVENFRQAAKKACQLLVEKQVLNQVLDQVYSTFEQRRNDG